MPFFDSSTESEAIGTTLTEWMRERFRADGLAADDFALTLLPFSGPLRPDTAAERPVGFAYRGEAPFYPCSVVKAFYLAAAHARLEEGALAEHAELDRAMRDMIRWSSNTATNYVIDLVTGTTGDTLLDEAQMRDWAERRQWVNRYFRGLGWPEAEAINLCQKLMDDDRYGREKTFVRLGGNNHNRLSTDAAARLFYAIFAGRMVTPLRSRAMAALFARPLEDPDFVAHQMAQVKAYLGAGLPRGAKLWSKAGWTTWTGDADASYRRHDAAYIELPNGRACILVVFIQGRIVSGLETVLPAVAGRTVALLG